MQQQIIVGAGLPGGSSGPRFATRYSTVLSWSPKGADMPLDGGAVRTHSIFTRNHVCKRRDSGILEEAIMPLIQVQVIEEVFTPAQKGEIVRKLTDAMVSIEGESMRPVTLVVIEEFKRGDWAMGGKPFSTDDVKLLAAGRQTG